MGSVDAILWGISARPDDPAGWLALADHYRDAGRADEAAAVRVLWPAIRDGLAAGRTVKSVLAEMEAHAPVLGGVAREIEELAAKDPEN